MSWFDQLQQASFRGVPFGVLGGESRFGRRVAVHEYPKRDKPYVEDLGRSTRRISLVGFLVEDSMVYGGGSALAQRDAMVAAAEQPGPGTLIHPTLGRLTVSIPDGGLGVAENWERGRYFELSFTFIESGDRIFPSISQASQSLLGSLADELGISAGADFLTRVTGAINLGLGMVEGVISLGNAVVASVVDTAAGFQQLAGRAVRDAANLSNLASVLTGNYGRYAHAATTNAFQQNSSQSGKPALTMDDAVAQVATSREAVDDAGQAMVAAAQGLDASSVGAFTDAVQAVVTALLAAIVSPADLLRALISMASYSPAAYSGAGQVGQAKQIAQDATAALVRRSALAGLVQSVAQYAPSSYDDAAAVRSDVLASLDAEILVAGDAGDDGSYAALRAARQGVADDLAARGASLAHLATFSFNQPLPALRLAQQLYQDPTRADQLVAQANPVHPAFMPVRFRALAR